MQVGRRIGAGVQVDQVEQGFFWYSHEGLLAATYFEQSISEQQPGLDVAVVESTALRPFCQPMSERVQSQLIAE